MLEVSSVSVIIPAKDEEQYIGACLSSVRRELDQWTGPSEVIVVDNISADRTNEIACSHGAKVVKTGSKKIGNIRNIGARLATGEVIAYIDADCTAPVGWISNAMKHLQLERVGAVGGNLDLPGNSSWVERAWAPAFKGKARNTVRLVGASLICKRDVFFDISGFDDNLATGEDLDLARRIVKHGKTIIFEPGCNVVHYGYPKTIAGFIDRQVWQVHGQMSWRKIFAEKSILASLLFSGSALLFLGAMFILPTVALGLLAFAISLVTLFSFRRLKTRSFKCSDLLGVFAVSSAYFIGRSLGVLYWALDVNMKRKYKRKVNQ